MKKQTIDLIADFECNPIYLEKTCEIEPVLVAWKQLDENNVKSLVYDFENDLITVWFSKLIETYKNNNVTIWFNNSSNYDNQFVVEWLCKHNFEQKFGFENLEHKTFKMIGGDGVNFLNLRIRIQNLEIEIKDFWKYSLISVEKMGKIIGRQKLKNLGSKYYNKPFLTFKKEEIDEFVNYCVEDVNVLHDYFIKFNENIKIDPKTYSASGLAFKTWKDHQIDLKKDDVFIDSGWLDIAQLSYHGGYTMPSIYCRGITIEEYHSYHDLNSAYSFSMSGKVPVGEPSREKIENGIKLYQINVIEAKLKDGLQPIIKNVEKQNDYFVEVKYKHFWVWEKELEWWDKFYELKYEIVDTLWFNAKPIFHQFVMKWTARKDQISIEMDGCKDETVRSNLEVQRTICKMLLNSLYGKFGENPVKKSWYFSKNNYEKGDIIAKNNPQFLKRENAPPIRYFRVEKIKWKNLEGKFGDYWLYEVVECDKKGKDKIPTLIKNIFIASYITMFVRCLLFTEIYKLKKRFLYCDTDSIFCIGEFPKENVGLKLGQWKDENIKKYGKSMVKYFKTFGAKKYIQTDKITLEKGKCNITIAGVNNYNNIYGYSIYQIEEGWLLEKTASKQTIKGKMIFNVEHTL